MVSKTHLQDSSKIQDSRNDISSNVTDDSVQLIREILFGRQLRAIDERFEKVESMLLTHNTRLMNLLDKRVDMLQEMIESRNTALSQLIAQERSKRNEKLTQLDDELREQMNQLRNEFALVSSDSAMEMAQLREALKRETTSLRQDVGDHDADLASLFQEMSAKLLQSSRRDR